MSGDAQIIEHYAHGDLALAIIAALNAAGKDVNKLQQDDLSGFDDFHVGGKAATAHLIGKLNITSGMKVADLGSGIGGTGRYIAQQYGARVMGIDLSPEYSGVANMLSNKVGLREKVAFETGTALNTPFADQFFDVVCTLHASMNISNKTGFYMEAARILHPLGLLGIYDIFKGDDDRDPAYPQPWSADKENSHLVSTDELKEILLKAGFKVESIEDRRGFALATLYHLRTALQAEDGAQPGIAILLGDTANTKIENLIAGIENRRLAPVEVIARKI